MAKLSRLRTGGGRRDKGEAGVEIQQLRYLIAAVECSNLIKAADVCHISQSGLSRSISNLEERLGVQLLLRKPRGVEPTAFGIALLHRARLIVNEVDNAVSELRAMQSSEIGEIVFGVTQNYGYYFIPEIIAELTDALPSVRLTVRTGGFLDLVEQLKSGAIDLVFGLLGPIDEREDIVVELLREHHSRVVARKSHPLALRGAEVTPEELAEARWATLHGVGFQRNFNHYFSSQRLRAPVQAVKTDSIALIRRSIVLSDLLAVLPPDAVREELDSGEVVILDCDAPAEQTDVGLVTRNASLSTPQRHEIAKRIRNRFAQGRS